ncbi:uncharacterized protein LOC113168036 isoform X3 [Anabas testudineus]|uniref:RING-type E3 ubiquitin transferase n=1 Tax=Anabas testudineus TaxID=64144 RepID=A0A3Q1KHV9_ANATE|nr:uncharacterized protein LOC113168036 isoform X3 [Anabas testudineus]
MQGREKEVKCGGAMSLPMDLSCLQGGGGADHESALATLEKQLICPICLELFNKPVVILPCQHNLCRKCANELYQPSLFQARTTMLVNSGRFRCPSCRHEVVLDRHGVYALPRNLLVENIIDAFKQEVSNNIATSSPSPLLPVQLTCSDHEGEKVNIYCLTCQVPTCSLCKVFGAHQSCQVAPLTDIYQQQKDELSQGVTSMVAVNDKIQALINELEEACRNIEENCRTQKQSVCDKFSRMFSILEDRRKAMTQQISSEEEEKTSHAQVLLSCYGDSVDANSKLMERAASSMTDLDMAAFVQNSRELITKVISASSSCPAETLKPGYENMSHYRFNFSRQEEALKSIDFIKAVEDVPEEQEVEPEPEESNEPLMQNMEPEYLHETSDQNLESLKEPVKEQLPPLTIPLVEPVQATVPTPALVPPAPFILRDWGDDPDLRDEGSVLMKNTEEEKDEAGGLAARGSVKERNICEGMSTQQCEGGEAASETGDWMRQREVEGKQDSPDEENEIQAKEGADAPFSSSWYKPEHWVSPALSAPDEERVMCWDVVQAVTDSEPQPPVSQDSQLLPETQTQIQEQGLIYPNRLPPERAPYLPVLQPSQPSESQHQHWHPLHESQSSHPHNMFIELQGSAFTPVPVPLTQQRTGAAGFTEVDDEEEEDMQGWVCLHGTADKSLGLVETSLDFGNTSLEIFCDNDDSTLSMQPETQLDTCKPSDGRAEDVEEKEQLEEDILGLNCAPLLDKRLAGEAYLEKESKWSDEGGAQLGNDVSGLGKGTVAMTNYSSEVRNDTSDDGDEAVEGENTSPQGDRGSAIDAASSVIADKKLEDGESNAEPEDCDGKMEMSEEKLTSCVSVQAVTLLVYLLAFLVILQRAWAYISCFICT